MERIWKNMYIYTCMCVKNLPANAEDAGDVGSSLGWEEPLEEGMATHCSILAWRIPRTEEPGGLQSTGSQRGMTEATDHIYMDTCVYVSDALLYTRN